MNEKYDYVFPVEENTSLGYRLKVAAAIRREKKKRKKVQVKGEKTTTKKDVLQ